MQFRLPSFRSRFALVLTFATVLAAQTGVCHAQRDLKDIPDADPELERKTFIVPEGFEVNLYAADPRIAKPIQINFDERGRLWVASSEVYPHIKPGQQPTDKILVLSDNNQDGVADQTQIFADGLLIPTGVLPGDGGAYVVNSTELLHLSDTDNDGVSDQRRIMLSGFGTEDTHHLLHTLRWGHDGAMYMNQSIYIHSHIETPYGVRRLNGGGIWRFRPDTLQLDVVCSGFVNPWGHHFDYWGQQFATDGAYGEGINYVFPGAVYVTAPGAKRRLEGLNPGSPKHCGLEIASGGHLPDDWQGSMLTNDFRAHRVCRFVVREDGSGYQSKQEVEVIKSSHVAFRPIDVKMGPDGAIYIADWYNPIIQHGEVDFRDPRRDHVHGRIWRVTAKGRPLVKRLNYAEMSTADLLASLSRSEEWIRLHAKRELAKRDADEVLAAAELWLEQTQSDAEYGHNQLEVLWLRQMMRQPDLGMLDKLLKAEDHRIRAAAMRVAVHWRRHLKEPLEVFAAGVADEHPQVRLEGVRALSELDSYEAADVAARALEQPMDRFLDFALWQAMRDLQDAWLPAVRDGKQNFGGDLQALSFALRAIDSPDVAGPLMKIVSSGEIPPDRLASTIDLIASVATPAQLDQLFVNLGGEGWTDDRRAVAVMSIAASTQNRKVQPASDQSSRLGEWLGSENPALRIAALRAVGGVKATSLTNRVVEALADERSQIRDAALEALADLQTPEAREALANAAKQGSADARPSAIRVLARVAPQAAATEALAMLGSDSQFDAAPVVTALLSRKNGAKVLAGVLAERQISPAAAKRMLRAARASGAPPELVTAIRDAGQLAEAKWVASPELIQQLAAESIQSGDPHRGQAIFRRRELQCAKCHAIGGSGGKVGPDLLSLGASAQPDYLVESLLSPNAKVKENFHAMSIQTDEGLVINGIVVRKSDTEIVLRDQEDKEVTVRVENVTAQKESRSLMPDGTVDELTRQELVDLVRFLSELGKTEEFSVGRRQLVRTWRALLPTKEATYRIRRTSYDTAASDEEVLQFEPAYSRVNGELPLEQLPGFMSVTYVTRQPTAPISFVRCRFEVTQPGKVNLQWNDQSGLTLWINGKPTPITESSQLDWKPGTYDLTIAINREKRDQPLLLELLSEGTSAAVAIVGGK